MYIAAVIGFMLILPLASIVAEAVLRPDPDLIVLVGKWFVFWGVGARLFTAGIRQALNPAFTATDIFRLTDPATFTLVRELGFGTLSIGLIGLVSIFSQNWVVPAAIAAGLFFLLAGLVHVFATEVRSTNENIAMISDLAIAAVLGLWLAITLLRRLSA